MLRGLSIITVVLISKSILCKHGYILGSSIVVYTDLRTNRFSNFLRPDNEKNSVQIAIETRNLTSVQYILVLTYMRCGSSFTSKILERHPQSFYVFEPLSYLKQSRQIIFINGTTSRLKNSGALHRGYLHQLWAWYTCNLHEVDRRTLICPFMKNGRHTSEFYNCIGNQTTIGAFDKCLPYLIQRCLTAKIRIIKTIRMSMSAAKTLLNRFFNLKMIHLVRDPRGILSSRSALNVFPAHNLKSEARSLCKQMNKDVSVANVLKQLFPSRLLTLQYESLAERPFKVTSCLYTFMGTSASVEVYGYVYYLTSMGTKHNEPYDVLRDDSKLTSRKWMTYWKKGEVISIDSVCKAFYKGLGYLPFNNRQIWKTNTQTATRNHVFNDKINCNI